VVTLFRGLLQNWSLRLMKSNRCLLPRSATTTTQHKMVPIKSIYSSYILAVSVYFDISHVTNRNECVFCSYATMYELRDYPCRYGSVCPCVCPLIGCQTITSAIFHKTLHAAQKCGCFERYCFRGKPEVD